MRLLVTIFIKKNCKLPVFIDRSLSAFVLVLSYKYLKSLGLIDRKFHGHGENDEFVLYEY